MAGIVAWIRADAGRRQAAFSGALSSMCHGADFSTRTVVAERGLLLGAVTRGGSGLDIAEAPAAGISLLLYGRALRWLSGWQPVSASAAADAFLGRGAGALTGWEGSYVIVVLDRHAGCIEIVTDRAGSVPVAWAHGDGWLAFAPEAKAVLPMLETRPRIDPEAALAFLAYGYPVGDRTMLASVDLLPPASHMRVDLATARPVREQYWQLAFRPDRRLDRRAAARELAARMFDAHRAALADHPVATALLLTGGVDSRVVLGALEAIGELPSRAVTWGAVDGIPSSDPTVARRLAAACSVPHSVLTYGAATFTHHAREWCRVSELACDNMGDFATGAGFLRGTLAPGTVVLNGDQMIGPGGLPLSRSQAIEMVTGVAPARLPVAIERVVDASRREELAAGLTLQVSSGGATCTSDEPKDLHDFLYYQLYVRRWLFAPASSREPMFEVRRPLLANTVVDLVATFPTWLRVDKRVLVDVLHRHMPRLARIPVASANSLIDWGFEVRKTGSLRSLFETALRYERVAATPLGAFLDADAFNAMVASFFSAPTRPIAREPSLRARLLPLRRAASCSPLAARWTARVEAAARSAFEWGSPAGVWPLLRRSALIVLLQEAIESGALARAATADTASGATLPGVAAT